MLYARMILRRKYALKFLRQKILFVILIWEIWNGSKFGMRDIFQS